MHFGKVHIVVLFQISFLFNTMLLTCRNAIGIVYIYMLGQLQSIGVVLLDG